MIDAPRADARRQERIEPAADEARLRPEHLVRGSGAPLDDAVPIRAQHRVRLGVQEGPEPDLARPHRSGLGHLTLGIGEGRDGLLALDGTGGQRAEQLDERDVVLEEERPPGQARLEETDPSHPPGRAGWTGCTAHPPSPVPGPGRSSWPGRVRRRRPRTRSRRGSRSGPPRSPGCCWPRRRARPTGPAAGCPSGGRRWRERDRTPAPDSPSRAASAAARRPPGSRRRPRAPAAGRGS